MIKQIIALVSSITLLFNASAQSAVVESNQQNIVRECNENQIIYNIPLSEEYQIFTKEVCDYYNFDYETILVQMYIESSYNSEAVSYANCVGLLQVSPRYCNSYYIYNDVYDEYLKESNYNLYDIKSNIIISIRELSFWRNECNKRGMYSISNYLNCYNRGYLYFEDGIHEYSDKILSKSIQDIESYYK